MHHLTLTQAIGLLAAGSSVAIADSLPLRIVDWNIRYATGSPVTNEKPWWDLLCGMSSGRCREPHVVSMIQSAVDGADKAAPGAVTLVTLQEALENQVEDVNKNLAGGTDKWDRIGHGRDDGYHKGEYNPIYYRKDQVKLVYADQKWLSPTPDEPSFGWGAGSRRIVVTGVFEHIATGKRFIHANTHLDNVSLQARNEGIKYAVSRVQAIQAMYPGLPLTLTGDFNSGTNGGDAWSTLKAMDFVTEIADSGAQKIGTLVDTWTDFNTDGISRIDFIWSGPNKNKTITANRYEIVDNNVDGLKASDHRMTYADFTLA